MSPFVHGRIYPETESSGLVGYTLRVLIDPRIVRDHRRSILDIDTLRIYLRDVESPCRIVLLLPAKRDEPAIDATYESMREIGVEELPSSVVITPGRGRPGRGRVFTFDIHADSELDTHVFLSKQSWRSSATRFLIG